jgi:hypothetical protein
MLPWVTMAPAVLVPAPSPAQQSLSIWSWSLARRHEGARSVALTPARFFREIWAPLSTKSNTHSQGTVAWHTARWSAVFPCPSYQEERRLLLELNLKVKMSPCFAKHRVMNTRGGVQV